MRAYDSIRQLLEHHPDVERVEAFVFDVNGVARGKWLPRDKALALDKGLAMPRSVFALDIWGRDVAAAGLAFGTGDPDSLCFAVPGRASLVPGSERPAAQTLLAMRGAAGDMLPADPRGVLARVIARLAEHGLRPVVATELEFYLHRRNDEGYPLPPRATARDIARHINATLSVDALAEHEALFETIRSDCIAQGIPADALVSEAGPGQFEFNLLHRDDALMAADDAVLMKRIVKAAARRHGLAATFMAKPYGDASGSGMHIHCSLLDGKGVNVFADSGGAPSETLRHAVAGLIDAMPGSMLAFAPHANSYRRFQANAHAPISAGWGLDDRSAAIRVVVADAKSTRIEHRVSGADCNPYLALAAVLAGIAAGIAAGKAPPPAQDCAAPGAGARLPIEWGGSIDAFASSAFIAQWFGPDFQSIFAACKRQDRDTILARVSDVEYDSYLATL